MTDHEVMMAFLPLYHLNFMLPTPAEIDFSAFPLEIVFEIISKATTRDLKNWRLVSRCMKEEASKHLFKSLALKPLESSSTKWNNVAQDPQLSAQVKHLVMETFPDLDYCAREWTGHWRIYLSRSRRPDSFETDMMLLIAKFSSATSVTLGFSRDVVNRTHGFLMNPEDTVDRRVMLEVLFQCLEARALSSTREAIESLTIINLANYPHGDLARSPGFRGAMEHIRKLHLLVGTEKNFQHPHRDLYAEEIKFFPIHLQRRWLMPWSAHLTSLSLYFDVHWGALPFLEVDKIDLPQLRSLALGCFVFAYPSQIAWIASLTSLENLILDSCPIMYLMSFSRNDIRRFDIDGSKWKSLSPSDMGEKREFYANDARWSQYFDTIRLSMPQLKSFRFGSGSKMYGIVRRHQREAFESRSSLPIRICGQHYVLFNTGVSPTPWLTLDSDRNRNFLKDEVWEDDIDYYGLDEDIEVGSTPVLGSETWEYDRAKLGQLLDALQTRTQ